MRPSIHVVIMAGGSGIRFWPYSREAKPKQFLDVIGTGRSLLQVTYDRFLSLTSESNIWIVTNEKYKDIVKEQLPEVKSNNVLLEPLKRNTAPCIAYASYKILKKDSDAIMVVTPADHAIFNDAEFEKIIETAISDAERNDHLITIGIRPNRPESSYGYIQYFGETEVPVKKVKTFTEKPHVELAKKFIDSGDFLWNSGIFVWSIDSIIRSFERHEEEIASLFASGLSDYFTEAEPAFIRSVYSQCKNISVDYAIMEKAENVYVVPAEFVWSDLGSWNALHEMGKQDENKNVIEGSVITYDSDNNYIKGTKKKLILVHGLTGYIVVDFEDVLLICKKEDSAVFRDFISDVRTEKGEKYI